MAADGALEIFPQIQVLVLDKLQVVSYKWLSRNFSVSSNYAKRLLQEFAEKHCNELEVMYTLSGWLKGDPQTYCVKLASTHKLEEVKQIFKDSCSVQVYSVQACIPNDLAVLWNAEFVQAEELFNRPSIEGNCLRDNRFCGVSNSFVKRTVDGTHAGAGAPWPKNGMGIAVASKTNSTVKGQPAQSPQQELAGKPSARNVMQSSAAVSSDKSEKIASNAVSKASKPPLVKESAAGGNTNKNKSHNEKASSGTTGSLASLWGHASAKTKAISPAAEAIIDAPTAADLATAEAQICAQEALDAASSEDEDYNKNYKRETNGRSSRKRRVVLDLSDDDNEEENVVSLASPDLHKVKHDADSFPTAESLLGRSKLCTKEVTGDRLKNGQDSIEGKNSLPSSDADVRSGSKTTGGISSKEKSHNHIQENSDKNHKDEITNSTSTSPKRRKVLKTRIDDRGREVTEVVWDGEAADNDKTEKNISVSDAANRPPVVNKTLPAGNSVSTNPGSKGGNKKAGKCGLKDAKQGNILSFFKRI